MALHVFLLSVDVPCALDVPLPLPEQALGDYLRIPSGPSSPGHHHDQHHAAYVAWIVVLVFGFASAVILLVYERRPRLLLSAARFGRSLRTNRSAGYDDNDEAEGSGSRWGGRSRSGMGRRGRPRGALTEMVMESEIGMPEASYRLLEDETKGEGNRATDDAGEQNSDTERRTV